MREVVIKSLEESEVNKLPSLPHILIKLLRACRDEDVCFDTVSDIISRDAALSAKIVSVANSPVYGRARHLKSLKHTLMFLGLDTIKSVAITASVQQFFSRYSNEKSQFLKEFWKHSLACALIARALAKLTSYKYIEEAYLAGLLHDIGKLVFETHAESGYKRIPHGVYPADRVLEEEREHFNMTHDELGALLLEKWEMPVVVADAVRYHHAEVDDIQEAHHLVKIINLANILACNDAEAQSIVLTHFTSLFDLSEALILELIEDSLEELHKIAASLNIDIGDDPDQEQDELKQVELAREIKGIALVQGGQLPFEINDGEGIYASIQRCLLILFGIKNSVIFGCHHDQATLFVESQQNLGERNLLDELQIPMQSRSLVSKAFEDKSIQDSMADEVDKLAVIDKQLIGALRADGMVCVPIVKAGVQRAVIVLGVSEKRHDSLARNFDLLRIFAQEIADKIDQAEHLIKQKQDIIDLRDSQFATKAREIIHETNNPLSVIRNYLQILSNRLGDDDPAQNDLSTIKEEIDRVGNIILRCAEDLNRDLMTDTGRQAVNVNKLISDIDKVFKSSLFVTHNINSRVTLADNIETIAFDKDAIKQIITNLIKNAVEAMGNNGELSITTRNININGRVFVEIEIVDNGPGIPEHILNHLYSPVESTKGKGHSGLGLSIVKNLIDSMGGFIGCKTGSTGTVFTVQIPHIETAEQ